MESSYSSRATHPGLPMKTYIGIDPGASGGLASISSHRGLELLKIKGHSMVEVWQWLEHKALYPGQVIAVLEKVGGFIAPKKGKDGEALNDYEGNRQPGHLMFNFGRNYGILEGFLIVLQSLGNLEYKGAAPRTWQGKSGLGIPPRKQGDSDRIWKSRLVSRARNLYPSKSKLITKETGDAVLLAHYLKVTDASS